MRDNDLHLSDQEILLYADGEIPQNDAARVREHLTACWNCRARSMELEGAIADFVQIHRSRVDAHKPHADGLRSSLKAQLAAAAAAEKSPRIRLFPIPFWQQAACAVIALLLVAAGMWRAHAGPSGSRNSIDAAVATVLPDRSLTPGYTRPVKVSELCGSRHWDTPASRDVSMQRKVFGEYRLPVSTSKSYELDYLITPELGGADDARNLWPEPYGSEWNAHVKDQLEDRLHTMVCDGQIDLATAQKDIATNWIAAYKRYFHTETPLANPEDGMPTRAKSSERITLLAGRFGIWSLP